MNKIELLGRKRGKGDALTLEADEARRLPQCLNFRWNEWGVAPLGRSTAKDNNLLGIAHGSIKLLQQPLILFLTSEVGVVEHKGIFGLAQGTDFSMRVDVVALLDVFQNVFIRRW